MLDCLHRLACTAAVLAAATLPAAAQGYSRRPVTIIVPYAPGGSTDPISRKYAELLEKQLKVRVIVENKPGASATIGTGAVIRAARVTAGSGASARPK